MGLLLLQSLGQKVTLQQATVLVESVAGKGAPCLSFTQFVSISCMGETASWLAGAASAQCIHWMDLK